MTCVLLWRTISDMRYTLKDFKAEYPDDDACLRSVLQNRYGSTCPKCGVVDTKFYKITGRKAYACLNCRKHIYPLAETIFRKSETSLWNWFYAIYQFSVSKNGVSAKELERTLGVTYKTAWRMCKQIRKLMEDEINPMSGTVEIDETYIGGMRKGKKRGRGTPNKSAVFGIAERGGTVRALVMDELKHSTVTPVITESVTRPSIVNTDSFNLYKYLITNLGYQHEKIYHSKGEYVRGDVHTNSIEGFWGNMKNAMSGTYHAVSPKYLQSYVNEFVFRYNFRYVPICPVLLERAAKLS